MTESSTVFRSGSPTTAADSRHLRRTFGHFATGVTVVAYVADGEVRGATVNSFTSVSLDPPLVMVSIDRRARAATALSGRPFVINVLAAGQMDLALHFAGRPQPDLDLMWSARETAPRLRGCVAWLQCQPHDEIVVGDHVVFFGEVIDHRQFDREPLIFQTGRFMTLGSAVVSQTAPEQPWQPLTHHTHAATLSGIGVLPDGLGG